MKTAIAVLGMSLCLLTSLAFSEQPMPGDNLVVTLSIAEPKVAVGDPVWLRMMVENQGKKAVRLVRPRGDAITRIGEYGWIAVVMGPQGKYGTLPEPREVFAVTDAEIIELAPGEFVGCRFRVGYYVLHSKLDRPHQIINETPGEYSVQVTYAPRKDGPFLLEKEQLDKLFLGPASSKKIQFEIVLAQENSKQAKTPAEE